MNTTATTATSGTTATTALVMPTKRDDARVKVTMNDADLSSIATIIAAYRRPYVPDLSTQDAIHFALSYTAASIAASSGAKCGDRLAEPI